MSAARIVRVLLAIGTVLAIATCGMRIALVNERYPEHRILLHDVGEAVAMKNSSGVVSSEGATLRVLGCEAISGEGFATAYPECVDSVLNSSGDETVVVVVSAEISNTASQDSSAAISSLCAQSRAWATGVDALSYRVLNDGLDASFKLSPGETRLVKVPFVASARLMGAVNLESELQSREFELVVATYPDKVSIDLGRVAYSKDVLFDKTDEV